MPTNFCLHAQSLCVFILFLTSTTLPHPHPFVNGYLQDRYRGYHFIMYFVPLPLPSTAITPFWLISFNTVLVSRILLVSFPILSVFIIRKSSHKLFWAYSVLTTIYREIRKFPLYNMCKPDKCTYIKKIDWSETFLCIQKVKTCIMKLFVNYIQYCSENGSSNLFGDKNPPPVSISSSFISGFK